MKIKVNWFHYPFVAKLVRIFPRTWENKPCLRFDLYGCHNGKLLIYHCLINPRSLLEKIVTRSLERGGGDFVQIITFVPQIDGKTAFSC